MGIPEPEEGKSFRCQVKVRYRHPGQYAVVEKTGKDRVRITFEEPVRAATPGQSAVFYDDNDCLLGGGIISVQDMYFKNKKGYNRKTAL